MKLTRSAYALRIALFAALALGINLVALRLFFRLDFTADQRYTLSRATRDILRNLENPVTVTAYFSQNLPPELASVRDDFQDLLAEYESTSGGQVVYEFKDPVADEALEQQALQAGIYPLDIGTRDKDQVKVQRGYMGAVVKAGTQQEVIPQLESASGMEFAVSAAIKKLTAADKPRIGLLQGHGEADLSSLGQLEQALSTLYTLEPLTLTDTAEAWAAYKTLLIIAPSDTFPLPHLGQLDAFLASGGRLCIALNAVRADLQSQGPFSELRTGLEPWLAGKGLTVSPELVTDTECGRISFQRQLGAFTVQQQLPFYYFPLIHAFGEHPVTQGLEDLMLFFASPVSAGAVQAGVQAVPLAFSSQQSGLEPVPVMVDPEREWAESDFLEGPQPVAVALEGPLSGQSSAKLVVIGDGDFALDQRGQAALPFNVDFLVNAVDWLTDDTGLIELRTRRVDSRPLLVQPGEGGRNVIKWLNFLVPIGLALGIGLYRRRRRKQLQAAWSAERYQEAPKPVSEDR
jgi:gliding-associated putative ABC transporter substrate-binding component GldG